MKTHKLLTKQWANARKWMSGESFPRKEEVGTQGWIAQEFKANNNEISLRGVIHCNFDIATLELILSLLYSFKYLIKFFTGRLEQISKLWLLNDMFLQINLYWNRVLCVVHGHFHAACQGWVIATESTPKKKKPLFIIHMFIQSKARRRTHRLHLIM